MLELCANVEQVCLSFFLFNICIKERKRIVFYQLIACLFHTTAIIGVVILFIHEFLNYRVFKNNKEAKTPIYRMYVVYCSCICNAWHVILYTIFSRKC